MLTAALLAAVLPGSPGLAALNHPPPSTSISPPVNMTVYDDSLVVAGDLTVAPPGSNAIAGAVHDLVVGLRPAAILLTGDLVHPTSSLSQLTNTFDPSGVTSGSASPQRSATTATTWATAPGGRPPAAATSTTSVATAAVPAPPTPATTPSTSCSPRAATGT
jgi:hypothetical protein